jgi:2-polyprenyl-3-methyl-5-hydroxy-6-metoxy-1,4-benzoquinol methylase
MDTIITYIAPAVGELYISEQPFLIVSGGTTGLRTWEASFLLSEWVLNQEIEGMNVLELGAGTGLVGILAAKKRAHVMLTDGSEAVVSKLHENLTLNQVTADVRPLRWGEKDPILDLCWDFILGADITYDEDICASLADTYAQTLRQGGVGILAATVRNESTLRAFTDQCGNFIVCSKLIISDLRELEVETITHHPNATNTFFSGSTFPAVLLRIDKKKGLSGRNLDN